MALHLDSQKVNSFTPNDFGDSPAQKKWFFGGLGPWNVKLGLWELWELCLDFGWVVLVGRWEGVVGY